MGVNMDKIRAEAPHLEETINMVKAVSLSKGINPDTDAAQVVATFDFSGSTEDPDNRMGGNTLYSDGTMETINELASAAGFTFDDDGQIPASLFHNSVIDLGNITPATCQGFITRAWKSNNMGGTSYLPALRWIVETVGLSSIDLGRHNDPLEVKYAAPLAVYAYFVTDGEPMDSTEDIMEYLRRMSQLPIFVQFIGVGNHNFSFLKKLDKLRGRLIDNAGFFDSKQVSTSSRGMFGKRSTSSSDEMKRLMLENMLSEFPSYRRQARQIGLITA